MRDTAAWPASHNRSAGPATPGPTYTAQPPTYTTRGPGYASTEGPPPQFVDIAPQAGIVFHHTNGASAGKHLAETMGAGGLFFDFDGDGWQDVFLVDSGSVTDAALDRRARHRLFRNRGDGTFTDVTERSGI